MTKQEVVMLERTLVDMGVSELSRPAHWASRPPAWFSAHRERAANEDPLAVVELVVEDNKVSINSSYRFVEEGYTKVSPEYMNTILTAMHLWNNEHSPHS